MDIHEIIDKNIDTISDISEEKYPALYYYAKHTSLFAHLLGILEYMRRGLSGPVWPKRNPRFFFFGINHELDLLF